MTYDWQIIPGDRVVVYYSAGIPLLEGVVKYVPGATGDSWIIQTDNGNTHYVQIFAQMTRILRAPSPL